MSPFVPEVLLAHSCAILRLWQVNQGLLTHFQEYLSYPLHCHAHVCARSTCSRGSRVHPAGLHAALSTQ